MKDELKNIILMGLGAMALTTDKAKELREELLEKGTKLYQDGKVANEELKHHMEQKIKDRVTVVVEKEEVTKEDLIAALNKMSDEEKKEIFDLLKESKKKESKK